MPIAADMADALNVHMGRELSAHLQYLEASAWFDGEGLPELARFFERQAAEEHVHALKFWRYLQDAGARVIIPALEAPKADFESSEEVVGSALDWERQVTRQIDALVKMARAGDDYATEAFLQWFVTEQVEEVATMSELLRVVQRAGDANLLLVEAYVGRKGAADGGGAAPAE
jgi:bacterioferritin B